MSKTTVITFNNPSGVRPELIIVHGGRAHMDDYLAAGLARHLWEVPIERRDPAEEELEDPKIIVLDVGGRLEPEKNNFDHHQIAETEECALQLYMKEVLPDFYEKMSEDLDDGRMSSIKSIGLWDNVGPKSRHLGAQGPSDFEYFLTEMFSRDPNGLAIDIVTEYWDFRIKQLLAGDILEEKIKITPPGHTYIIPGGHLVVILDNVDNDEYEDYEPLPIMKAWAKVAGFKKEPHISVIPNPRGEGWSITRRGAEVPNFNEIKDDPRIDFVHSKGFLCTTHERLPIEDVLELCEFAYINLHKGGIR